MESPHPAQYAEPPLSPALSPQSGMARYLSIIDVNRSKLNQPWNTLTTENIILATSELLSAYKELIMLDLAGGIQRQLELSMWYYCFKGPLQHFMRHDNAMYHHFIETGIGFYLGFIHDVGIHFDVPFVRNTQRGLYGTAPSPRRLMQSSPPKGAVYYILQNSLIRVGDLLRYRSSLVEALKMYDKAVYLCPRNGHPFHQMGSTQTLLDSNTVDGHLTAIYYYARAVSVSDPYVAAQHSLDGLLTKVKSLSPASKVEEFMHIFLVAVANPQPNVISSSSPSFVAMLSPLVTNNSINSNQIFRIIVIALWAWRRESTKTSITVVDSSVENIFLEIIAAITNSLLIAANAHTDLTNFYALPHLKILMDWLRVNSSLVINPAFRTKLHTSTLCTFFNHLLVLENNVCGMRSREVDVIILPEEKRLLGFLPFCRTYENLNSLLEESDPRIAWVRIYRTLKCAYSLSESRLLFIERHGASGYFAEVLFGSLSTVGHAPAAQSMKPSTRRNVALESIFNQLGTETLTQFSSPLVAANASEAEPGLPVSSQTTNVNSSQPVRVDSQSLSLCKTTSDFGYDSTVVDDPSSKQTLGSGCTPSVGIIGSRLSSSSPMSRVGTGALTPAAHLSSFRDEGQLAEGDSTDFSGLFRSIWTPRQDDTTRTHTDGWTE